jgi:hypothetical protein
MGEENLVFLTAKSVENTQRKSMYFIVSIIVTVGVALIADMVQFGVNPINTKISHVDFHLASPAATSKPSDLNVNMFLEIKSRSLFFDIDLTSSTCDVDYVFSKLSASPQRTYLTNIDISDVKLMSGFNNLISEHYTSTHEVDFTISGTQYDSMSAVIRAESATFSNPKDRSFVAVTCTTRIGLGYLSIPFKSEQLLSLDTYKQNIQAQIKSLSAKYGTTPSEVARSVFSQVQAYLKAPEVASAAVVTTDAVPVGTTDKTAKPSSTFSSLPDLNTDRVSHAVSVELQVVQELLASATEKIGYFQVHMPAVTLALQTVTNTGQNLFNQNNEFVSNFT